MTGRRLSAPRDRGDDGAIAILVVILTVVLIGSLAFVTDFGMAYANQRRLQNGADAAALAIGQKVAGTASPSADCPAMVAAFQTPAMRSLTQDFVDKNAGTGLASLQSGSAGFALECKKLPGASVDSLVVHVADEQKSPGFFGGIFGRSDLPISKEARVAVGPAGTVVGLRPFALCKQDADKLEASPMQSFTFSFDNADAGCGYAPGNWGTIDLNGGSNSTAEMKTWIETGYDGSLSVVSPLQLNGDTGALSPGAFEDSMNVMITNDAVVLPVYDSLTLQGSGATYNIIKFVSVKVCGWKFNSQSGDDLTQPNHCFVPPSAPVPTNYLQVRFNEFIPIGELNLTCKLGDGACDGPRVFALVD